MSTFGSRLRALRTARGLSQQALAGTGVSAGYISLLECDKRAPSAQALERLASRLGVPVAQLVPDERDDTAERTRVEVNFARLAIANGTPADAVHTLQHVSWERVDDETDCAAALALAEGLEQTGDLDRAVDTLEQLMTRCRQRSSWLGLATAATTLTTLYIESGDMARSVEVSQEALAEVDEAGLEGTDEHLRLGAVHVWACFERGDLLFAAQRVAELIEVADRIGTSRGRGSVYWNAALVAHARGHVSDALRLTERALALLAEQDESRDLPRLRMQYAWLLLNSDHPQPQDALHQLDRAESDPSMAGAQFDRGQAATLRGRAHLLTGDLSDAAEHAAWALQLLGPSGHIERASALILLGDVGSAQRDLDLARESYGEAITVLRRMSPSREVSSTWRALGDSLRALGDERGALDAYDTSLSMLGMSGKPAWSGTRVPETARRALHKTTLRS